MSPPRPRSTRASPRSSTPPTPRRPMPQPSNTRLATANLSGNEYLTGNSVGSAPGGVRRARGRRPFWLWGAVVPIVLLVVWQLVASSGVIPIYRLPRPIDVYNATIDLAQRGILFPDIAL